MKRQDCETLRYVFVMSSDIFGHLRILVVPYENSWHSKIKNFTPTTEKKTGRYPGGEGTPLYKPYRYVLPQQVGSWAFLV